MNTRTFDAADDDKDERLDANECQSFGNPHGHLEKMVMVILELVDKIHIKATSMAKLTLMNM